MGEVWDCLVAIIGAFIWDSGNHPYQLWGSFYFL